MKSFLIVRDKLLQFTGSNNPYKGELAKETEYLAKFLQPSTSDASIQRIPITCCFSQKGILSTSNGKLEFVKSIVILYVVLERNFLHKIIILT